MRDDTRSDTRPSAVEATRIDPKLLEMLVCPLTKESLDYDAARQELISRGAKLAYPIRDGIPDHAARRGAPADRLRRARQHQKKQSDSVALFYSPIDAPEVGPLPQVPLTSSTTGSKLSYGRVKRSPRNIVGTSRPPA